MSTIEYSSFENYEFIGEFFVTEDSYSTRFPGKIEYDMESGLTLNFNIADADFPNNVDILLGILDNGQKCSLIGPFDFSKSGIRLGSVPTKFGKKGFKFLVIGDFVAMISLYSCAHFTFSHMQEFFYPQGWIDNVKYKEGVIERIQSNDWDIDIVNRATFMDITHGLKNLVWTNDESVADEIVESINDILAKAENKSIFIRKTLDFVFIFSSKSSKSISDLYEVLYRITSLFSIFMNIPVFPDEIRLSSPRSVPVQVLASQLLESRTVELAKSNPSHHFMPINRRPINLSTSISRWLELYDSYQVLSTTFQYETGFRTMHAAYSDIVLYLANIEAIAIDLNKHKESKYIAAIERYATSELISSLSERFKKINTNDLGKNLADLRGELVHEGRPKKLMKRLTIDDYVEIGSLLKLVVVARLLDRIGVEEKIISDYQNKLVPRTNGA